MIETPTIVQTELQRTAVVHLTVPREDIQNVMGPGIEEVMQVVAAQGVGPAGAWFTHHLRLPAETFDFEVGVPVTAPVVPTGRVRNSSLPAATVARAVYCGPYEGLGAAWGELDAWIAAQGRTPEPYLWECYVAGPEADPDPSAWRTELSRPLAAPGTPGSGRPREE